MLHAGTVERCALSYGNCALRRIATKDPFQLFLNKSEIKLYILTTFSDVKRTRKVQKRSTLTPDAAATPARNKCKVLIYSCQW